MIAYKLLSVRKDGSLGPLFINRRLRIQPGTWLQAECHPTKGFAIRPGWHATSVPVAPHLGTKGRRWFQVELLGVTTFERPECQGGTWLLARWMKVIQPHDTCLNVQTSLNLTTP
jgi:hypothetical protein